MRPIPSVPNLRIFYLLLIGVGSIVAHLASEFAGMGADADSVVFSPRHWYLGIAALAGVAIFAVRARSLLAQSTGPRDLKRALGQGLEALPLRGQGMGFFALTAGLQLGIGALTEIGEGCPFCGHDVIGGALGALLVVLLLALVTRMMRRRLPSIVIALAGHATRIASSPATSFIHRTVPLSIASLGVWFPLLFNRPPPQLQYLRASA